MCLQQILSRFSVDWFRPRKWRPACYPTFSRLFILNGKTRIQGVTKKPITDQISRKDWNGMEYLSVGSLEMGWRSNSCTASNWKACALANQRDKIATRTNWEEENSRSTHRGWGVISVKALNPSGIVYRMHDDHRSRRTMPPNLHFFVSSVEERFSPNCGKHDRTRKDSR